MVSSAAGSACSRSSGIGSPPNRAAEVAAVYAQEGPINGGQPVPECGGDGVIDTLLGQGLSWVRDVASFGLGIVLFGLGRPGIGQLPLHAFAFRGQ